MFKNALVSCSNKDGLVAFLRPLQAKGLRIVSTGGTAKVLKDAGLSVVEVMEQTGFPEVMDGRVKTLHPHIHMALLARADVKEDQDTLKKYKIEPFDLVVGNLYPFEGNPSVETIDIGGPSFLRAAAKNFSRITVVSDPSDYGWISEKQDLTLDERRRLASKVFAHTAAYDAMISRFYNEGQSLDFRDHCLGGAFVQKLRYGENPQQMATWYRVRGEPHGLHEVQVLQGKELSYNNLLDIEAAVSVVREFRRQQTCVAVKHNNPCGVATAAAPLEALKKAIAADPQSVFGGIVATNFEVDSKMAETLDALFLECVVAPAFSAEAKSICQKKKNLRLLEWPNFQQADEGLTYKSLSGGFLVQQRDHVANEWQTGWAVWGEPPSASEQNDLLMAWKVCSHLKSNAIAIVSDGQTVGLGMGQVNRVDAVEHAIGRMKRFHPSVKAAVLASDAFFPFADSIEKIAQAQIRFVIQPGGSLKDEEVKARAKELGVTLILTGKRHFLH